MRILKIATITLMTGFMFYSTAGAVEKGPGEHKGHRGDKIMKVTEEIDKIIGHFREKLENEPKFKERIYAGFDLDKDGKLSDSEIKNALILAPFHMRGPMMPPPPPGMHGYMPQHPGMRGNFPPPPPEMMGHNQQPFWGNNFPPPPPPPFWGEGPRRGMNGVFPQRFGAFKGGPDGSFNPPKIENIISRIKERMEKDSKFKEHITAKFDTNKDGILSDEEIKNSIKSRRFEMKRRMMQRFSQIGPPPGMDRMMPPPPPFWGEGPRHEMNGERPQRFGTFKGGPDGKDMRCHCMRGEMRPQPGMRNAMPGRFGGPGRGAEGRAWNKNKMFAGYKEFNKFEPAIKKEAGAAPVYTESTHSPFLKFSEK